MLVHMHETVSDPRPDNPQFWRTYEQICSCRGCCYTIGGLCNKWFYHL